MEREQPTGFILAGGLGTRMGQSKAQVSLAGKTLIERVAEAMAPSVGALYIVAPGHHRFASLDRPIITDEAQGRGPLAGIQAALRVTKTVYALIVATDYPLITPQAIATITGMAPVSDPAVVSALETNMTGGPVRPPLGAAPARSPGSEAGMAPTAAAPLKALLGPDAVVPHVGGRLHPLCALYAARTLTECTAALDRGELMVRSFVARLENVVHLDDADFGGPGPAARLFMNVNTPEDLRRAEEALAGARAS